MPDHFALLPLLQEPHVLVHTTKMLQKRKDMQGESHGDNQRSRLLALPQGLQRVETGCSYE